MIVSSGVAGDTSAAGCAWCLEDLHRGHVEEVLWRPY